MLSSMWLEGQTLVGLTVTPNSPTIADDILVSFKVTFPNTGAQKQNGTFYLSSDSLIYTGCYFRPGLNQGYSEVPDSIFVGQLPAGYYHFIIYENFVFSIFDTACINVAFSDTADSFLIVAEPNIIIEPERESFSAMLLSNNRVVVKTDAEGVATISVIDVNGRLCFWQDAAPLHTGTNQLPLNIPHLPAGVYFYQVQMGDRVKVLKWVQP